MSKEEIIRPWKLPDNYVTINTRDRDPGGTQESSDPVILVTDPDCIALADFTYDGDELPVFEVGDRLLLKQGGEAFFVWDLAHNVIYRTDAVQWLFYYLAFEFKLCDK
jgi:hypothetical protein